jgi:hypothetical protein
MGYFENQSAPAGLILPKPVKIPRPHAVWYIYRWNRMGRKGQMCRVLARGSMNSCLVEFDDKFKAITSRNALRRSK